MVAGKQIYSRHASRGNAYMLPFGRDRSLRFRDSAVISEKLTAIGTTKVEYWAAKSHPSFRLTLAEARSRSVRLVAAASTPMHFTAAGSATGIVLVPFVGRTITHVEGRQIEWGQKQGAIYLPPGGCRGESTTRTTIGIDVEPKRLEEIARAMFGPEVEHERLIDFETPREINLKVGGVDLDQVFRHQMMMLDALGADSESMEQMGLADMILRSTVLALAPQVHLLPSASSEVTTNSKIKRICDYIDAHLAGKITLTELEQVSGLSARSLQYSFRAVTGLSPVQWINNRRLEEIRRRVVEAKPGTTLSEIVSEYFSNMGDFSRRYREKYGERPSETLARAQKLPLRT